MQGHSKDYGPAQVSQSTHGILRKLLHDLNCETWAKQATKKADLRSRENGEVISLRLPSPGFATESRCLHTALVLDCETWVNP